MPEQIPMCKMKVFLVLHSPRGRLCSWLPGAWPQQAAIILSRVQGAEMPLSLPQWSFGASLLPPSRSLSKGFQVHPVCW